MRLIILCICLSLLIFAAACSKDKDKTPNYSFLTETEWFDFSQAHNWGMNLFIVKNFNNDMDVSVSSVWSNDETMNSGDTYTLKLNDDAVTVSVPDPMNPHILVFNNGETNNLPIATSIKVVFTRNGTTLLSKSVVVPDVPTDIAVPTTWDISQPMTFSWALAKNSHLQSSDFYATCDTTYGDNNYVDLYTYLPPSTRTQTYPANSINLAGPLNAATFYLSQFNVAEYKDNYVGACTAGAYWYSPAKHQLVKADTKDMMKFLPPRPYNGK